MASIPGIELHYQTIADAIESGIHDDWENAVIEVVYYSDSIDFNTEYLNSHGKLRGFLLSIEGQDAFIAIRRAMVDASQTACGQMTFGISRDGRFSLDFGYADCDERGNTIFDEAVWIRQQQDRRERLSQP